MGQWLPKTAPGLLFGFILDGRDHRVSILDQACRIDLLMTLDVGTSRARLPAGRPATNLSIGLKHGDYCGNRHSSGRQ